MSVEHLIRKEASPILQNPKMKLEDILAFHSQAFPPKDQHGFVLFLPRLKLFVCFRRSADKRKPHLRILED